MAKSEELTYKIIIYGAGIYKGSPPPKIGIIFDRKANGYGVLELCRNAIDQISMQKKGFKITRDLAVFKIRRVIMGSRNW